MFPFNDSLIKKIRSVRPDRLVSLFPQNEPVGHAISTEIIRGYHGAYTAVTLGQPGIQGSGLTSAGYDGATSYNNIYTAGFANDNLLLNPGFEMAGGGDPDFWLNWSEQAGAGTLANEVVIVHEGNDACKATFVAGSAYVYQNIVVVPGERRRLRIWTRGDGAVGGRYQITDLTNTADIQALRPTGVTAAVWTMVVAEYTVPAGCVLIREFLYSPSAPGSAYFDACEDRRVDGFLGDKGTIIVPAQVANAGVWTDGVNRRLVYIAVNNNNRAILTKSAVNNNVVCHYVAGGVLLSVSTPGMTTLDWFILGLTWDISAGATGEARFFIDGVQSGATLVGLGTWLGDIAIAECVVGAKNTVPTEVFSGNEGPVPVWSDALTPDEMRYLGT